MSGGWKEALVPTPDCIPIARLGEELSAAERAHVDGCVRCQTELALFTEMMREESSPESQSIADELRRGTRGHERNVVAFPRHMQRGLLSVAAAFLIFIGIAAWMQFREPAIGEIGDATYRSARLELVAPIGDIAAAPNELRWSAVPNASRYQVRLLEVDGTIVWSAETSDAFVALPPVAAAQFRPGKTLSWDVRAYRGNDVLASSETQSIRVTP